MPGKWSSAGFIWVFICERWAIRSAGCCRRQLLLGGWHKPMKIETCVSDPDDVLEKYRPRARRVRWDLVASGYWSEDMYHSGHIAYFLARLGPGRWVLDAVERNTELDSVTEEDVEEGRLNDDQIQAMWGQTLEEAQNDR